MIPQTLQPHLSWTPPLRFGIAIEGTLEDSEEVRNHDYAQFSYARPSF